MKLHRTSPGRLILFSAVCVVFALNTQPVSANEDQAHGEHPARFSRVFSDHMVLQRQQPIHLWGRAQPGSELTVSLADQSRITRADADGNWQTDLRAMPEGGPYHLSLQGAEGEAQLVSDVLIGDVWLCSGQSNMEVTMGKVNQSHAEPSSSPGTIRVMNVPQDSRVTPQPDFAEVPGWQVANDESIGNFSALCYLLAYELQKTNDIPFGLVKAAWGGAGIKTWIGAQELEVTGRYKQSLELLRTYANDEEMAIGQFGRTWEDWWARTYPSAGEPWNESAEEMSGWKAAPGVMGNWRKYEDPSLADHLGMVWFRKSFDLNGVQAEQGSVLALGGIDEVDYLWINGSFIGSTFGYGTERFYRVPPGIFRTGANTITVNVLNTWDAGGMVGPNDHVKLEFDDGQTMALGYDWFYRKVPSEISGPPRVPWESLGGLTGLSNAMIAPLDGLKLAGAIWYQGETDAGDPGPYEQLLTALTADWRGRFSSSLPILVVQLPRFGKLPVKPGESGWAAIRDAQRRVAISQPATGLVVSLDTGDFRNLHPPDKRVIGQRAADVARALVYGQAGIITDGLSPTAVFRQGNEVVVDFDPAIDQLAVVSAKTPAAFELCGEGPDSCAYADARIEGNRIWLTTQEVGRATRVRHCWADAPVCNLYGASGLPVSSFEIEISHEIR